MSKQRLIDANALMETYKGWLPQLTAEEDAGDRNGVETCIAVLEDAPTIDAIPVEWLHEKMQEPLMTSSNPFVYVMAEWEKEQEAQDG